MTKPCSKWHDASASWLRTGARLKCNQRGLTLIELMVALVISMVISLAAISGLIISQRGFRTVDASSQLRDNGRFSSDLIQRLAVQSGFKDRLYAATEAPPAVVGVSSNPAPNITGFNNALIDGTDPLNTSTARTTGVDGYGSDILILRYQATETFPGSGISDGSMIDCAGNSPTAMPASRYDRRVSIIHVAIDQGEPTLMCSYSATGAAPFTTQAIVQGVENFQVLYGTASPPIPGVPPVPPATGDSPTSYLRADEFATNDNWRLVRSLRIGMVLRGPPNSAQDRVSQTLYPFGLGKSSASGSAGSAMSSSTNDPGTVFPDPADGRLRQVVTFTVHLRNDQGL